MKNKTTRIIKIFLPIIIQFLIWQSLEVSATSISTFQPASINKKISTQKEKTPNNKIIQKSQTSKPKSKKKTIKKPKKESSKKQTKKSKTTKPKIVNTTKNINLKNVNLNSKTDLPKNWGRYITPPIIIITLILLSIFKKY